MLWPHRNRCRFSLHHDSVGAQFCKHFRQAIHDSPRQLGQALTRHHDFKVVIGFDFKPAVDLIKHLRCWPVLTTMGLSTEDVSRALMSGATLIASGLVP